KTPDGQFVAGIYTNYAQARDTRTGFINTNRTAVILTVNALPNITAQPVSVTNCTGSSVTFSVTATGTGLTYEWRKGSNAISGATGSSYTIASVNTSDAVAYDVLVSGTCSPAVTSSAATLVVNTPPNLTGQPANVTTNVGASATFSVTATGTGLTYQWR